MDSGDIKGLLKVTRITPRALLLIISLAQAPCFLAFQLVSDFGGSFHISEFSFLRWGKYLTDLFPGLSLFREN
jgi:hypothetical protein